MNVLGAILAIKVQVQGVQSAVSSVAGLKTGLSSVGASASSSTKNVANAMADVKEKVDAVSSSVSGSTRQVRAWTNALLIAGAALAYESIQAYESFEKTRRSFVAFTNEVEGNALANWISEFSTEANTATRTLSSAAQKWLSATGDSGKVRELLTGLERLGGLGKSNVELERTAKALADIQGAGKFRAQEFNQLVNAGIPGNKVAEELGVKNFKDALGRSANEVVPAILRALNKLPKQPPLLFQQIANQVERLQRALIPTGQLFTTVLQPVVWIGSQAITVFELLNKYTFGFAGALGTVVLAGAGIYSLLNTLKELRVVMAATFSIQAIQGFFSYFPKIITALRSILSIQGALAAIETIRAVIATAWAFAVGNPGAAAAIGLLAIAGIGGIAYASGAFGSKEPETAPQNNDPASRRPYTRSSAEDWLARRMKMAGA